MAIAHIGRTEKMNNPQSYNETKGQWEDAIPEPFYFGLFPWIKRRLTGWRDEHGRKAQLFLGQ